MCQHGRPQVKSKKKSSGGLDDPTEIAMAFRTGSAQDLPWWQAPCESTVRGSHSRLGSVEGACSYSAAASDANAAQDLTVNQVLPEPLRAGSHVSTTLSKCRKSVRRALMSGSMAEGILGVLLLTLCLVTPLHLAIRRKPLPRSQL